MERIIGNEYCCAISPPAAPDFCLHMALFYRRCNRTGQPLRTSPATVLASPPPTPPPARPLPLPPGCCRAQPPSREPRMGRYAVYRLIYESGRAGGGHHHQHQHQHQPPLHRLFVETGLAGPVRGLYLDVTGSPETGMRYTEMPGDDPERLAAAAVSTSSSPLPSLFSASSASPPSSSAPVLALQTKTLVGTIAAEDFDRFRDICRRNPPPPRQFDGARRLVPWVPVRRSQDWVHESIARSVAEGILDVGLRQQSA
ncbi:hypothetical protein HRG_004811 [Hirsutella rhossiliensis]|uniref:Uncharacterized protein n=1 Tax=Hirsutella rhossiliensis TaxID=111463 RepID=A0A9P8SIM9_9HYPO|nr:uncharacterized protein HRG_04811 [Hirsutella rhossiliensis]KAH0964383.1 hypothetical protein HRG_04811 [Hirsutella rhossiliensis]